MSVYGVSLSGLGNSVVIPVLMKPEAWIGVGGISMLVNFSGSSGGAAVATATVQVSNDPNLLASAAPALASSARWNNHDVLNGITADKNSSLVYPVLAIRLQLTAWTSGTVTLQVGYTSQI